VRVLRSLFTFLITAGVVLFAPGICSGAFAASPQGQGSSLHGFVIVGRGAPIPNANVTVEGAAGAQAATTNAAGEYTISGLGAGDCHIRISAPGFDPYEITVSLTAGTKREVDAVLFPTPAPPEPAPSAAAPETAPAATPEQNPAQGNEGQTAPQQAAPAQQTVAAQALSVKAEKGKAALYGNATDQSGAVIQGASATVTGPSGTVTVNANTLGQYVINGLAPGQYKLSVSAPGFAPFQTDVTVASDQALELDSSLTPKGNVTEVNVQGGGAAEIQTESAQVEGTITQKEVLQTGLNGRNFTQLIALAPGVSNQTGQDEALVGVKGSVKYSVNGGRVEYNNFDVDGSDVLNAGLNGAESTLMVYPSLDGIQEVKVLTSNYGAQYGRSASGTVLVTTRSGTHDFHGVAYDFIRNEFFNARNYFDETSKAPLYRRQDFGGAIGGPLTIPGVFNSKRDKTFFFWSEEFRLEKTPQEFNQAVPTRSEQVAFQGQGIGVNGCPSGSNCVSFQDVCPPPGTALDRSKFPDCPVGSGNSPVSIVPVSDTSQAILNTGMIPLPNSTTGCNSSLAGTINIETNQPNVPCYVAVISPSTYWREELGRFDHSITQNLHLMARYIHDSWDTTQATPLWGYVQNSFPTVQQRLNGPGTSMVVRLTDTISPKLLNDFVISYVNAHITLREQNGPGANVVNNPICDFGNNPNCANGMNYIFHNGEGGKPPGVAIAGTNAQFGGNGFTVDPSYAPWDHTNPTYSLGDDVGLNLGHHTLHFGVQVVDAQRSETNGAIGAATGDLQGLLTFSNQNSLTTGNAFADFLVSGATAAGESGLGGNHIKSYQQDSAQIKYYNNYWITEPYAQDDWRVTPRLTVNIGLRLSLFGNFQEKNHNAWNWVAGNFTPVTGDTIAQLDPNGNVAGGYLAKADAVFTPIPFDPTNLSFSNLPSVITNGLVHCGTAGVPSSCMSTHFLNPAPRIGFAWDPKGDGKTSLRGGYGVFFEHGTPKEANTGSLEGNSPLVLTMTDPFPVGAYNGIGLGGVNSTTVAFPPDVTSIPTKAIWPYVQQWSFSVQRQLPKDIVTSVAYVGSKGTHLNAELQINQLTPPPTGPNTGILPVGNPYTPGQPILTTLGQCIFTPGSNYPTSLIGSSFGSPAFVFYGQPAFTNMLAACFGTHLGTPDPGTLRPYFGYRRILSLQNIADSQYHAFQFTMRRTRGPLTVGVSYTYSHSLDDSSDRSDSTFVNSANIRSSWASSSFDQRHLFNFNYVYDLPKFASTFRRWVSYRNPDDGDSQGTPAPGPKHDSGLLYTLLDGWQLSGITTFQSGTPFSIINGGSNNLGISVLDNAGIANGAGAGSFPDVLASPRSSLPNGVQRFSVQSIGPLLYNPAAFEAPQGLTFGNAGRNFLNNPHRINFDMSGFKDFKITEGSTLEFRAEAFNVFNHTQFRIFNPNLGNSAQNTISCYGGGLNGAPFTAIGGPTPAILTTGNASQAPGNVDCTTGASFLRPVDAHRPRTIQLGLKYSF
jgi:Carboxypeptidase regulatory-like domain